MVTCENYTNQKMCTSQTWVKVGNEYVCTCTFEYRLPEAQFLQLKDDLNNQITAAQDYNPQPIITERQADLAKLPV